MFIFDVMLFSYEFIVTGEYMKNNSKINLNVLSIFYLLVLFVQIAGIVTEILYEYVYQSVNTNVLIQLFIEVKRFFNDNWLGVSIFSIVLIPLNNLYYTILNTQNDNTIKKQSRNYLEYIFCIINILMYCEVYNIEKVKDNIKYIKSNILSFAIVIFVVICVILLSNFLSKYIVAKNARNDIIDEIVSREENSVNKETHNSDGKTEVKVELNNDLSQDQKEILKHPFSYAYENYKLYRARRKAIKYTNKLEIKKIKENNLLKLAKDGKYYGDSSFAFIIISIIVLIILVVAVYIIFKEGIGENEGIVSEICKSLNTLLKNLTNGLEITEPNLLNFIMVFGIIILVFISYILLVYTLTYIWKVWLYLAKRPYGNNENVERFVDSLEKLFSGTIDEIVHLLMFIPDVLNKIIGIVYNDNDEIDDNSEEKEKNE